MILLQSPGGAQNHGVLFAASNIVQSTDTVVQRCFFALSVLQDSVSTFAGIRASVCPGACASSRWQHASTEGVPRRHAIGGRLASDRRFAELPGLSDRSTTVGPVVRHGLNTHLYIFIFGFISRRHAHT